MLASLNRPDKYHRADNDLLIGDVFLGLKNLFKWES
jgi:hypothetical protein